MSDSQGTEALARDTHGAAPMRRSVLRQMLLNHPEAVLDDPAVSAAVVELAGSRYDGNVVSLEAALMGRMRQRMRAVEVEREEMFDAAEANLISMMQVHDAALALMDAVSFAELIDVVGGRMKDLLHVDSVRLCMETSPERKADASASGHDVIHPIARGTVRRLFRHSPLGVLLREVDPETLELHGVPYIGSEALIRLDFGPDVHPGLLCFGVSDPDRFHEDQSGDLLLFLGSVMSRVMRDWLTDAS